MSKNEEAMADDDGDEEELTEAALERQLQEHLVEQKASLIALEEALAVDPSNQELLAVHEELTVAIKGAEESLLQLKRTRLLGEIDAALGAQDNEKEDIQEELNASSQRVPLEDSTFPTGSKCRFRHVDGCWYNGQVIELENEELARVSFLTPTTEKMQICKFYMQQRCRFGGNCRMSHGVLVPRDALRQFVSPTLQHSSVGSAVLACVSPNGEGIWRQAELESWDEALQSGSVIFVDDGRRLEVGLENLCISEYANVTDEETTSSEDDEDESEEAEDDGDCDEVTFGTPVTAGAQTDTRVFARWEKHTRGMASKMMANMGYREGMGLGRTGQGIVTPLQVKALPKHQSLDFIGDALHQDEGTSKASGKKKSRGGKRKRDRKLAEAARAVKAEEARAPDVFGFINNQLAGQHGHTIGSKESAENESHRRVKVKVHKEDRRSLIAQADEVADLRNKVEKLEEMALRNKKDKAVYDAVARKLEESRRALLKAEADHLSASLAVHSKEKEKKWLRF